MIADLSGMADLALPELRERQFVSIDRDSFDRVLVDAHPRLALRVDNVVDGVAMDVELTFRSLEDFQRRPATISARLTEW